MSNIGVFFVLTALASPADMDPTAVLRGVEAARQKAPSAKMIVSAKTDRGAASNVARIEVIFGKDGARFRSLPGVAFGRVSVVNQSVAISCDGRDDATIRDRETPDSICPEHCRREPLKRSPRILVAAQLLPRRDKPDGSMTFAGESR
jgi:hypothetical protein